MENKPFWQQLRDKKLGGNLSPADEKKAKKSKGEFFKDQIAHGPKCCENCGGSLAGTKAINPAAIVAHILPKNPKTGFPSVAENFNNIWFACGECHTNYDNMGTAFVKKMKVFPLLVERVARFYDQIDPAERRRVPEYFRPK